MVSLVAALRRQRLLMAVVGVLIAVAVAAGLATRPPVYRSVAVVTVAPPPPAPPDYGYIPAFETARTARDIVQSPAVADEVARRLGGRLTPGEVASRIDVTAGSGWQTLTIVNEDGSPTDAEALARASLEIGLTAAADALPENSQLEPAGRPSAATEVRRPLALQVVMVLGVAVAGAVLIGLLADGLLARERRGRRP
jgi:capsular polysaccharide biosynthesis protein